MKKIVLSLAVLATVALVSCGNKNAEATDTDTMAMDTTLTEEVAEVVDTDSANGTVDTTIAAEAAVEEVPAETPAK